jgi:hypothetical protein
MLWSEHLILYYRNMIPPAGLPPGIELLYPQANPVVMQVVETFYNKFFSDQGKRVIFLGINPGRFGAGVTGVNFTAPRQLSMHCGIGHPFKDQSELSAEFIYDVIEAYGGAGKFYKDCFLGSVSPLGFIKNGKNINYYDDRALIEMLEPFITLQMQRLLSPRLPFGDTCICIGGDKNYRHLYDLNKKNGWFREIKVVPHPRFIMQYRRKFKDQYIREYLEVISALAAQ